MKTRTGAGVSLSPPPREGNSSSNETQEETEVAPGSETAVLDQPPAEVAAPMPELVIPRRPPLPEDLDDRRLVLERERSKPGKSHPSHTKVHFACLHCVYGERAKRYSADLTVPLDIYGIPAIRGSPYIYTYNAEGEEIDFDFKIGWEQDTGMKLFHRLEKEMPPGLPKQSYMRVSQVAFYLRHHYENYHSLEDLPAVIQKKTEDLGLAPSKAKSQIAKRIINARYQEASRARKKAAKENGEQDV